MAKRKNPHRRLLAAQAKLRQTLQAAGNAEDAGKLQQGRVRSPVNTIYSVGYGKPNPVPWEGRGKLGSVSRGKFKPKRPGVKPRRGVEVYTPKRVEALLDK